MMADNIIEANVGSEKNINNDGLHKAITQLKAEEESGHKRNINHMTQVDDYKSPWKDKDSTTVNDTVYTFLNSWMMIQVIRVNSLRRVKRQSKILMFMTHQLEPLMWTQLS